MYLRAKVQKHSKPFFLSLINNGNWIFLETRLVKNMASFLMLALLSENILLTTFYERKEW